MSIKLIATDMDGTFLRDDHTYNHSLFNKVFRQLERHNIFFVAASGSSYPRLQREFKDYTTKMGFISQNGSVIHLGNKLFKSFPINQEALARVIHVLDRFYGPNDINQLVISTSEKSYVDQGMSPHDFEIVKLFYENVERVPDIRKIFSQKSNDDFTKISINFANHINLKKVAATLDGYLPPSLIMENSGFNTDLIGNAVATKQNALSILQKHLHLKPDEIVTFGDNENDLGMLAMTSQSYAMKNAQPIIQMQAAHTTRADNNHDGVLQTINDIIKNNR
ncbi:HAD-IIB family hydrolase [Limosilactobacillus caviae]|uniref:HAD-IIB family hydrolase n=1 Tax=Limosilactobacillus caviae TaxID=1769424 RepID=UPI00129B6A1D|nr:HAD-IIB family hydrolase [Limosilactobacillus caviae]MCD7124552.1 HAD-IIB family hydrolase [Limosilactobacillus caviae]MRH46512.1 HAD-IIB family hydrolase [Limosilactobacillus reuteri]